LIWDGVPEQPVTIRLNGQRRADNARWPVELPLREDQTMPFDGSNYVSGTSVTRMLVQGRQQAAQGWCQHAMRQRGLVCMIGSFTIEDYTLFTEAEGLLLKAIASLGYSHSSVAQFNDHAGRTKHQVLEVYDLAIERSMMPA
jgi:hypothetical protein